VILEFPYTLPLGLQWPNIDPLRIVLLLIEVACVIFGIHLAFKFFKNYRTMHDSLRGSRMHAAWGWLFFTYAITTLIYIIGDYYALDSTTRYGLLEFGYLSLATGALFYIYNIEGVGIIKTRHAFTIIFSALYAILVIMVVLSVPVHIVEGSLVQYFAISFWIPMIILFFIYTAKINKLIQGKMKLYSTLMIIGLFMFVFGFMGATDFAIKGLGIGLYIRVIGDIMQITGIGMMGMFFSMLPSWREIDWRAALKTLFVIYKGGICIYQQDFQKEAKESDGMSSMMVGGALEMVKSVLQQVLQAGSLKVLDFKDKKLLLEQGEQVLVVMIADTETDSLRFLLHEFVFKFERFYYDVLKDWQGDSSTFEPTKALVKELFG